MLLLRLLAQGRATTLMQCAREEVLRQVVMVKQPLLQLLIFEKIGATRHWFCRPQRDART